MARRDVSEVLEEISQKLDKVIALLACQGKDVNTQIRVLRGLGLSYGEISEFTGISSEAVRKRLFRAR